MLPRRPPLLLRLSVRLAWQDHLCGGSVYVCWPAGEWGLAQQNIVSLTLAVPLLAAAATACCAVKLSAGME